MTRALVGTVVAVPLALVLGVVVVLSPGRSSAPTAVPAHEDIPEVAVQAYVAASPADGRCAVPWSLLAGIAKVETDHGRHGGSAPDARGLVRPPILGPVLDGSLPGTRPIADSDGGRLDTDARWDRAVGPLQFIPQTWARWGRDGNADGRVDPHDLFDAAAAAAAYLCAAAADDLGSDAGRRRAVRAYNRSDAYVTAVLTWADRYAAEAAPATVRGDHGPLACPVVPPVHFIDSWHFPRSGGRVHLGQDLFAPEGTPLLAVEDGTIAAVRTGAGLGGNVIWLEGRGGHHWYYAHLRSFAPGLAVGDHVVRGQVIGTVGRTGNAATTPPHLHIQWRPDGRRADDVNPYALLSAACPGHLDPR